MYIRLLLVLGVALPCIVAAIYCPPNACEVMDINCPAISNACRGQITTAGGGLCGCCPLCLEPLATQTCAERRAQIAAQMQDHIDEYGIPPLGSDLPSCGADGTYSPVQCQGSGCSCVMPDGSRIDGYSVHRWENQGMNCACARAKETVRQSGLVGVMHRCMANGNYEPVQCRGSVCYCVDATGRRVGQSTAAIGSSDSLNC